MDSKEKSSQHTSHWLTYTVAIILGISFAGLLISTAWMNNVTNIKNEFYSKANTTEQNLKLFLNISDGIVNSISNFLISYPNQSALQFDILLESLLQQEWIEAIYHYQLASTTNNHEFILKHKKQSAQYEMSYRLPKELSLSDNEFKALKNGIKDNSIIPISLPKKKQILFLKLISQPQQAQHLIILSLSEKRLLKNLTVEPSLSITIQGNTDSLLGRQTLVQNIISSNRRKITTMKVENFIQRKDYSVRLLFQKALYWVELDKGTLLLAVFIGLSMTLLLYALARTKEQQAYALATRNFVIQKQVESQTKELKKKRDQALAASRAKSDFLATVSHEIRTPINAIIGSSELLNETDLTKEQKKYVGLFKKAADSLLSLVDNILDLSKIEAKQIILERIRFNIRILIEEAVDIYALKTATMGVDLAHHIDSSVSEMRWGDPERLRQVMLNLIGNAIKFTSQGHILITVQNIDTDGKIRISVQDTGTGIPKDKHIQIFSSFTQADSSTTRKYGGTGLGLTISKELIELMGGKIMVNSIVHRGSTFFIELPLTKAEPPPAPTPILAGKRILVFDKKIYADALSDILTYLGGQTQCVYQIEAANNLLMTEKSLFDLFFTKNHLPQKDFQGHIIVLCNLTEAHSLSDHISLIKPIKKSDVIQVIQSIYPDKATNLVDTPKSKQTNNITTKKNNILLVDDNADNRLLIKAFLKSEPYLIDEAENGLEAIKIFKKNKYDIVLMDIQMPVMNGHEAVKNIRMWEKNEGLPATPIVSLTAHVVKEEIEKFIDSGSNEHLGRPIRKNRLIEVLKKYLS